MNEIREIHQKGEYQKNKTCNDCVNLIYGKNSAGKSSIIQSIRLSSHFPAAPTVVLFKKWLSECCVKKCVPSYLSLFLSNMPF